LVNNVAATVDEARKGDLVCFTLLRADGSPLGPPVEYRLGSRPPPPPSTGWTLAVEECLLRMRCGNVMLIRAPPVRVRLDRHVPRRCLPSQRGHVDVTRTEATEGRKKRPQAGAVVWFLRDGEPRRRRIPQSQQTPEEEALMLLCPGQAGVLVLGSGDTDAADPPVLLEPTHAAVFEDVSAAGDASLWKLALNCPSGCHDRARMGKTVDAIVDGQSRSWRWGRGTVDDVLELAAFRIGVSEEAEIWADPEGPKICSMKVIHVGDDMEFVARGLSIEEVSCEVAKALYLQGRFQLASWHWSYVRDSLPAARLGEKSEDEPERRLASQAVGNLAACALQMGRYSEALAHARKSVEMRRHPRAVDWLRLCDAARAQNRMEEATLAAQNAAACADITRQQRVKLARLRSGLREDLAVQAQAEKLFCKRVFAH
jgi:hypothetical protein